MPSSRSALPAFNLYTPKNFRAQRRNAVVFVSLVGKKKQILNALPTGRELSKLLLKKGNAPWHIERTHSRISDECNELAEINRRVHLCFNNVDVRSRI